MNEKVSGINKNIEYIRQLGFTFNPAEVRLINNPLLFIADIIKATLW